MMAIPMIGPKVKLQDYGDEVARWLQTATGIENARLTGIGAGYKRIVEVNPDQGDKIPTEQDAPLSLADEAPYLLTSTSSLKDLNQRMQKRGKDPVDMRRFRPNIVIPLVITCTPGFKRVPLAAMANVRSMDLLAATNVMQFSNGYVASSSRFQCFGYHLPSD